MVPNASENLIADSIDRLNGMLSRWGITLPTNAGTDQHLERAEKFASELQDTWMSAFRAQMETLLQSNKRLSQSIEELVRSRQLEEVAAAEAAIVATLIDGASSHARQTADAVQKLQQSTATFVRLATDDFTQLARRTSPTPLASEPDPRSVKQTAKQSTIAA